MLRLQFRQSCEQRCRRIVQRPGPLEMAALVRLAEVPLDNTRERADGCTNHDVTEVEPWVECRRRCQPRGPNLMDGNVETIQAAAVAAGFVPVLPLRQAGYHEIVPTNGSESIRIRVIRRLRGGRGVYDPALAVAAVCSFGSARKIHPTVKSLWVSAVKSGSWPSSLLLFLDIGASFLWVARDSGAKAARFNLRRRTLGT